MKIRKKDKENKKDWKERKKKKEEKIKEMKLVGQEGMKKRGAFFYVHTLSFFFFAKT